MKKSKTFVVSPSIKHQLEHLTMSMSSAISQAVLNAYDDDGMIVKALKRRLALPPTKEENESRICATLDPRIHEYADVLAQRSQLPVEQILRLSIEAYLHKL